MRAEQEREEEKIARTFYRKIRSHEEGKSEGEDLQIANIPRLEGELRQVGRGYYQSQGGKRNDGNRRG